MPKLNRDRLNHLLINEIVSTHLKWISSDARMQIQVQDNYETTLTDINLKGKNPHIYEAMEDITAEYSTLFKTPDTLFNIEGDINTPDGYDSIYEAWILDKEGALLSLSPSIGNFSFPCKSHYFIKKNCVQWA